MCSGIAIAHGRISNFDACVSAAEQRHADSIMDTYLSYKCDGAVAQRLAARPDQCGADVRPSRSRIVRSSRQLEDGLYLRMIWRTGACAGMCETRSYSDARETKYLCEVRRHIVGPGTPDAEPPRYPSYRRYLEEYPPRDSVYRGAPGYAPMEPYEPRRPGRWVYGKPPWYHPYDYPGWGGSPDGYRRDDDDRSNDYRRDGPYRRDDP
jgi:hypothetical protein